MDELVALPPRRAGGHRRGRLRRHRRAHCDGLRGRRRRVAVVGRSAERGEAAGRGSRPRAGEALVVAGDLIGKATPTARWSEVEERFGRVDVLVNAVGGGAGTALYPAEEYPEPEWDRIVDLNLRSALLPSQAAARAMIRGGRGGRILNVSSVRGQLGIDAGFSAYVAAKGALDALTRQHATEWAKHGITVNAISPTFVRTPQVASRCSPTTPSTRAWCSASRCAASPRRTTSSAPRSSSAPTPRPSSRARC